MKRLLTLAFVVLYSVSAFGQSSKARTFNGTSDNLQSAATINLSAASTVSVSFWGWFNSDAATQFFMETSADSSATVGAFVIFQIANGNTFLQFDAVGGSLCKWHFADASAAAWHHYLFVINFATCASGAAYVDGSSQSITVDINTNGTTSSNSTLNVMSRNKAADFMAGRISDIAFWPTALTSGNASTLAACGNPQTVNGTPSFYWPINQTSPEVATDGGVNLVVAGTTNSASNCLGGGAVRHTLTLTRVGH